MAKRRLLPWWKRLFLLHSPPPKAASWIPRIFFFPFLATTVTSIPLTHSVNMDKINLDATLPANIDHVEHPNEEEKEKSQKVIEADLAFNRAQDEWSALLTQFCEMFTVTVVFRQLTIFSEKPRKV